MNSQVEQVARDAPPNIGPNPFKSNEIRGGWEERLCTAYTEQQKGVPNQTALVWRVDLGAVLRLLSHLRSIERDWRKERLAALASQPPVLDEREVIDGPETSEIEALRRALHELREACLRADARGELDPDIDGSLLDAAGDALERQFPIIWSDADVALLVAHQADQSCHPYTCGGVRSDAAHRHQAEEDCEPDTGILFPTKRGWRCPVCDYRQFWAHGVTNLGGPDDVA